MNRLRRLPRVIVVNFLLAAVVWIAWAVVFGPRYVDVLTEQWEIALTMIFGSLVGGGTSEGGGAVGFPILTKVLGVPADTARIFTFAIQSMGMTAASLSILLCRVPIERRAIIWGAPPAVLGAVIGVVLVAPNVPLPAVRVTFTMVLVSLAIALVVQLLRRGFRRNPVIPRWSARERVYVVMAGAAGGVLSGIAGVGENTVMFILLVLLFRVSEKIATPTTVILMTVVSVASFLCHVLILRDFNGVVVDYWIAAVPVVVVGAPLGAWICTRMSPMAVRTTLWVLISAELISTLLIVPFTPQLTMVAVAGLVVASAVCVVFVSRNTYAQPADRPSPSKTAEAVASTSVDDARK